MFAGFRSRWMMPCSCAASSASAICRAIGNASSSGIGPARDPLRQILALDQFHHERAYAARIFQAVDMRDVRMIEGRERLRFAREPGQAIGIAGEGVRKDLQRDVAIQLRVVARYTSPMPPAPRAESISYGPSRVPGVRANCRGLYGRERPGRYFTSGVCFHHSSKLGFSSNRSVPYQACFVDLREKNLSQRPTASGTEALAGLCAVRTAMTGVQDGDGRRAVT